MNTKIAKYFSKSNELDDQVAIITGAAQGIERAVAK